MSSFKKKLFTKLVQNAGEYNKKHKSSAKRVTYFTLGLIVFLSILFFIPEKICELLGLVFKKKGVLISTAIIAALALLYVWHASAPQKNMITDHENVEATIAENSEEIQSAEEDANNSEEENLTADKDDTENKTDDSEIQQPASDESKLDQQVSDESEPDQKVSDESESEQAADENNSESDQSVSYVTESDQPASENSDFPQIDLTAYIKENPDVVGWLVVDGTQISYPIMQAEDNEKYLTSNSDGETSDTGAIFLDSRSKSDFTDSNSIIYGHNMKDRSMFGSLRDYRFEKGFYDDHKYIYVITAEKILKYLIFCYMDVPKDYVIYDYVGAASDEFVADAEPVRLKSYMDSEIPVKSTSKVITLSTCTDSKDTHRFVVCGVLEEEISD
ncbi:class B sortase [Butyrivibrio sp. INlla16]|uniref:class B sortase n=1 Tax=Butyrivibrio sp. INlla16 TaxID=1520807 RepID=UPI00088429A7|nr:class B sortase [Butyrivibrio sp. INlla16]SDB58248.1 sortase, SrtB family [Butyrivibrio sp. INlla16]